MEQTKINFGKKFDKWEKSIAIKDLEMRLRMAESAKYPNVPAYALKKFKREDKTANGLQKCIIEFLQLEGWQAERINVMGRPVFKTNKQGEKVLDKWITGQGTTGSADISATIAGRSVKIEVKIGRDKQRKEQLEYQQAIERAGGMYVIAKTFNDFVCWYNENFK